MSANVGGPGAKTVKDGPEANPTYMQAMVRLLRILDDVYNEYWRNGERTPGLFAASTLYRNLMKAYDGLAKAQAAIRSREREGGSSHG